MREPPIVSSQELKLRLELIEKQLQDNKHAEALAEIRDFECTQKIEELPSEELFQFHYLRAVVLRITGSYQDALASAKKAFHLVRGTGDDKKTAQVQFVMGLIHVSLGNLKNAEMEIRDALTGFRRVSDFKGVVSTLSKLAFIESIGGSLSRSVELLQDALKVCDEAKDERCTGILHGNLGAKYTLIGSWEQAEENLRLNVEFNEKRNEGTNLARGLLSLGYLQYLKRKFRDATSLYEKALRLIYENNLMREMAIYYEYYGELAFAQGNYFLAKDHYKNGIKIGEEIAPDSGIISQIYRLLAEVQIAEKEYDQALSSCDRVMKVATSLGEKIEIGAIHRALGQIHTARREKEKAKENFEKSVSILDQIGAKFELGKAHLEAVKSNAFEYVDRVAHYARGKEIFKELESDYHVAMITLAFCEFLCERGEYEKAEVHITGSEKILKRLGEKRELDIASELRGRIDRALGKIGDPGSRHRTEYHFSDVITQDPQMLALIEEARKIKDADVSILLEGETGTGKDLLAKVIHCESKRKDKRFVKVNCAAIPDNLLESELFGYKRGAFSGADKDKRGLLEEADGGTIFLNEIGDLPLGLQAKMLDVIEDKEITRLGEVKSRKVDFRVMVATNKNLNEEVDQGGFRKDLYHRLNVVGLRLPPLRDRRADIPLLIAHFLAELGVKGITPADLEDSSSIQGCVSRAWSGNVRELQNELKRLVSILNLLDARRLLEELSRPDTVESPGDCLSDKKAELEKVEILGALKKFENDREQAARFLGISKTTLYRKMKMHNLE